MENFLKSGSKMFSRLSPASYAWAHFVQVVTKNACSGPRPPLPELAKMTLWG
jgi:hypothetical protein